jgi:hypothetical protein
MHNTTGHGIHPWPACLYKLLAFYYSKSLKLNFLAPEA